MGFKTHTYILWYIFHFRQNFTNRKQIGAKLQKKIWSVIYFFAQNWALKIAGMTYIFEQFFSCNSGLVDTCLNYRHLNYCSFELLFVWTIGRSFKLLFN